MLRVFFKVGVSGVQTCTAQGLKMSHFGELPDVVLPKITQKWKKNCKMVKIWRFIVKSHIWQRPNPELLDFGTTRCGFHKNSQIFTILLLVLVFLSIFLAKPHLWQLAKTGQSEDLVKTGLLYLNLCSVYPHSTIRITINSSIDDHVIVFKNCWSFS